MKVKQYIRQFDIIDTEDFNSSFLSQLLYKAYINKFLIHMEPPEYEIFQLYQNRFFDLIENMREFDIASIKTIFTFFENEDPYVVDNIIMSWCLPRPGSYSSKKYYDDEYSKNIAKFNSKLLEMVEHRPVKNFCIECITKTCNIPIHCINILWHYLTSITVEFDFCDDLHSRYLSIILGDDPNIIRIGLNLVYVLNMGLGKNPQNNFNILIQNMVNDPELINLLSKSSTKKNYIKQLMHINKNIHNYFSKIKPLSDNFLARLNDH